jgi:hypothetical protein
MSQFNEANFGNPPPKKKSPVLMIVIILLVVLVVLPAICCGLVGYFGYSGINSAMSAGAREIIKPIEHSPPMEEHIGEVTKVDMSFMEIAQHAEKTGEEGVIIINVQGSKGKGKLLLKGAQGQHFEQATLQLPDGRSFPIEVPDHGHEHGEAMEDHGAEEAAQPAEAP